MGTNNEINVKNIGCYFILIIFCLFISCKEKVQKKQSDFFLQIPESEIGITASKRIGAEFYVMFSKDSVGLSDNVDYLKYKTGDMSEVNLIFDPRNKNNIYIRDTEYLKDINSVNYNLQILEKIDFFSRFFERHAVKKKSFVLKYPFIFVGMYPSTYGIYIKKYEVNFKWIKEGDIYGGW
jgi:hypothetical protein